MTANRGVKKEISRCGLQGKRRWNTHRFVAARYATATESADDLANGGPLSSIVLEILCEAHSADYVDELTRTRTSITEWHDRQVPWLPFVTRGQ